MVCLIDYIRTKTVERRYRKAETFIKVFLISRGQAYKIRYSGVIFNIHDRPTYSSKNVLKLIYYYIFKSLKLSKKKGLQIILKCY